MKLRWRLMIFYFLSILGLMIYLKGYFPIKISRVGFSSSKDVPPVPMDSNTLLRLSNDDFQSSYDGPIAPPSDKLPKKYDKLVLIVINALREDFVFGGSHLRSTPFIHKLLLERDAISFISKAQAPAVTMPRIKALVTGSVPSYSDIILSLDEPKELKEDNFVTSAFSEGRSVVFYGDETWTKLFPRKFKRQESVSSFFINEYKTVDDLVTKNVIEELKHPDNFDIMILHYLGLGHIGHIAGSRSPLIDVKLQELDSIVQMTYETLQKHDAEKNTRSLIVVTGDHGMTDKGSHGGTTQHERTVPLLFLSPGINKDLKMSDQPSEVHQTDVIPTLSLLLGLPIPRNSMGQVLRQLLQKMNSTDLIHALEYNCHHLLSLAGKTGLLNKNTFEIVDPLKLYKDALLSHATWLKHVTIADKKFQDAKDQYMLCQQAVSDQLMYHVASYDYMSMGCGMILMWFGYLVVIFTWSQIVLMHKPIVPDAESQAPTSPLTWGVLATMGTLVHGLSLLSSSFLEEEHQTWYFLTSSFLMVLGTSVLMDQLSVRLGMADYVPKGFFAKRPKSPGPGRNKEETMELLRRTKSEDSVDASWDFVELEASDDEHTFDRTKKSNSGSILPDSNGVTLGILAGTLLSHRLLRGWNCTGIQNVDESDIGDWLNEADHHFYLVVAHGIGLFCIAVLLEVLTFGTDIWRRGLTGVGLLFAFLYRLASAKALTNGESAGEVVPALLCYTAVLAILARAVYLKSKQSGKAMVTKSMDYAISSIVLLGSLLLRAHNIWGLVFNLFLYWSIFRKLWPIVEEDSKSLNSSLQLGKIVLRTTLCYWFGQMAYFSLGNSNSLATIDVSSGYVGISTHSGTLEDTAVRTMIMFTTYVGPIIWTSLCLADAAGVASKEFPSSKRQSSQALLAVFSTFAFLRLTPMAFYLILSSAMRYHVFVWSVFAPKLLYETASTVIYGVMLLTASLTNKWII